MFLKINGQFISQLSEYISRFSHSAPNLFRSKNCVPRVFHDLDRFSAKQNIFKDLPEIRFRVFKVDPFHIVCKFSHSSNAKLPITLNYRSSHATVPPSKFEIFEIFVERP